MNLYIDDDSVKVLLVTLLTKAGHQVVAPANVAMAGASDPRHLIYAVTHDLVILTRNHKHFLELHQLVQATHGLHSGMLVVCAENDPTRDMKDRDIVRAISNLERAGVPVTNELHILNHWR